MKNTKQFTYIFSLSIVFALFGSCKKIPEHVTNEEKMRASEMPKIKFEETVATVVSGGKGVKSSGTFDSGVFRLLPDSTITADSQTWIYLDSGSAILSDRNSEVKVSKKEILLKKGRIWVKSEKNGLSVKTPQGLFKTLDADFDISVLNGKTVIHIINGVLSYVSPTSVKSKLESGTYEVTDKGVESKPSELWIDWTGGLSKNKYSDKGGYGLMSGERVQGAGLTSGYKPLILRKHKVEVKIKGNLAVTSVKQVFFNPVSYVRGGEYKLKIPENAVITDFKFKKGNASPINFSVMPLSKYTYPDNHIKLIFMGRGEYQAYIPNLPVSAEVAVSFSYAETVNTGGKRYVYKYFMAGGAVATDFDFGLRIMDSGSKLRAGFGGKWNKYKFEIHKNDFKPVSDFTAEIFPSHHSKPSILKFKKQKGEIPFMISVPMDFVASKLNGSSLISRNNLIFILDLSGSIDSVRTQIIKTTFASVLEKLNPKMNVEVFILRNKVFPLDGKGLSHIDKARKTDMIAKLSRIQSGGATNLGEVLKKASVDIPQGDGLVIYIGDGRPTRGSMIPEKLKEKLAITKPEPLFKSILLDKDSDDSFVSVLGDVYYADSAAELAVLLDNIMRNSEKADFKNIKVVLPPDVHKTTPAILKPLSSGESLFMYGYAKKRIPRKIELKGWYKGKKFSKILNLEVEPSDQYTDFEKLWAISKIRDMKYKGAGYEAIVNLARAKNVLTPYTGMIFMDFGSVPDSIKIPPSVWADLPEIPAYKPRLLKNMPTSRIVGISLPDTPPSNNDFSIISYYKRLLEEPERKDAVKECFDRRALFGIKKGGYIVYSMEISETGKILNAERINSSLQDKKLLACIDRVIKILPPFPAPPSGEKIKLLHTYNFSSAGQILPQKCSSISRKYIGVKKRAWIQRLMSAGRLDAYTAYREWKIAEAACELSSWLEKRALLDIIMKNLTGRERFSFASFITNENFIIRNYVKEKIQRSISSEDEAKKFVTFYSLGGGALYKAMIEQLIKWKFGKKGKKFKGKELYNAIKQKIAKFYKLEPNNAPLVLFYAKAAIKAGDKALAETLTESLINRSDLTSGQRLSLAKMLLVLNRKQDAALVMSDSVEFAPYDPYTRKTLGDFFRSAGMLKDALSEYKLLNWLIPQSDDAKILLSELYYESGKTEASLMILENIILNRSNKIARNLLMLRLAELSSEIHDASMKSGIRARIRVDGLLSDSGNSLMFYRFSDQRDRVQYAVKSPDIKKDKDLVWQNFPVVNVNLNLVMLKLKSVKHPVLLRFFITDDNPLGMLEPTTCELTVLTNLWTEKQTVQNTKIKMKYGKYVIYEIKNGKIGSPVYKDMKKDSKKSKKTR